MKIYLIALEYGPGEKGYDAFGRDLRSEGYIQALGRLWLVETSKAAVDLEAEFATRLPQGRGCMIAELGPGMDWRLVRPVEPETLGWLHRRRG